MSDGGKGDRPRPFSVSQQEFANSFDRIFGKKEMRPCNCRKCLRERGELLAYNLGDVLVTESGLNEGFYGMVVCPTCGNKRCPHATDHKNACTNSNEPGQNGSIYG